MSAPEFQAFKYGKHAAEFYGCSTAIDGSLFPLPFSVSLSSMIFSTGRAKLRVPMNPFSLPAVLAFTISVTVAGAILFGYLRLNFSERIRHSNSGS